VLITHAGNNSVTEAIAHGVPMVALPFSTDQFDGAAAVERAGFGVALDPNNLRPGELRDAVASQIGRPTDELRAVAHRIARQPGTAIARAAMSEWRTPSSAVSAAFDERDGGMSAISP